MKSSLKAILFAVPFIGGYYLMRSLPVTPCDFLHEETYNADGAIDYCGPGDSLFVDLSLRKWPLTLDFRSPNELHPGQSGEFELDIRQFDGTPLAETDVALSHTRRIHLLAVDQTLSDYHHLHPEPDALHDGVWRFSLTPRNPGRYAVFLDFIPTRSPRRVLLTSSFEVAGQPSVGKPNRESLAFSSGKREFKLERLDQDAAGGGELKLLFRATDQEGKPLRLRPVMGAFAHMVAFDSTLKGFAHLHPEENVLPAEESDSHEGTLTFAFTPPKPGFYRLWAQVRIGREPETFVPFDLKTGS